MNEQMKQLMGQTLDEKFSGTWSTMDMQDLQKFAERFAELIVRECLEHGKLTQSQAVVNGSEEYNAGREMGIEVFMNQIKKHFGVE